MNTLLGVRKAQKRRKPLFVVKEAHHGGGRVKWRWRAARGIHSYVRQMHRGRPAQPTPGYGSPLAVRGLHPSGREPVLVYTSQELAAVNPARQGAVLASTLGQKKRVQLLNLAVEKGIPVLNVADPRLALEALTAAFARRKKVQQERQVLKQKKVEEKKKQAPWKKKVAGGEKTESGGRQALPALDVKSRQEQEKELAEKVIIQKQ